MAPIILAAGLIVTAGTAVLLVARSSLISAFGPTLAITVLVSMLVSISLVPAFIAVFGRMLYWPHRARSAGGQPRGLAGIRDRLARFRTAKPVALVVSLVAIVALSVAGWEVLHIRMGCRWSVPSPPPPRRPGRRRRPPRASRGGSWARPR